jgi:hypothetical protein
MSNKSRTKIVCNTVVTKEVSTELGLPLETVKAVVSSQSYFTKQVMESGTYDSVRWPYLGIFKSKPKEVQMISHLKGMTPEQQKEFKIAVRRGLLKLKEDVT